jgi:hypothetical protein
METSMQGRLYSLAKHLRIGRLLRYGDLWARYLWRRGLAAVDTHRARRPDGDASALGADLAEADMAAAKRTVVASWFPLDLANAKLHRAMLESVVEARPEFGVTPESLDCTFRLKRADDLSDLRRCHVDQGDAAQTVNTALYVLLLRRLPAPSKLAMIASHHPRHALIAILSGDECRQRGRRALAG